MLTCNRQSGFSLVELSIVLVILGLLTGGILAGQSLIRAAELRSIPTQTFQYVTAIQSFRDKYFSVPGDFRDATRFWGRQYNAADCPTNSSATVAAPGACDGDGNGVVSLGSTANTGAESFRFWRHLALAGLIEGQYSGISGSGGGSHAVVGDNIPATKLSNVGIFAYERNLATGTSNIFALTEQYGRVLQIGKQDSVELPYQPFLSPEELWNIDTKMDDGLPSQGNVIARWWDECTTAANNADRSATYALDQKGQLCSVFYRRAF